MLHLDKRSTSIGVQHNYTVISAVVKRSRGGARVDSPRSLAQGRQPLCKERGRPLSRRQQRAGRIAGEIAGSLRCIIHTAERVGGRTQHRPAFDAPVAHLRSAPYIGAPRSRLHRDSGARAACPPLRRRGCGAIGYRASGSLGPDLSGLRSAARGASAAALTRPKSVPRAGADYSCLTPLGTRRSRIKRSLCILYAI